MNSRLVYLKFEYETNYKYNIFYTIISKDKTRNATTNPLYKIYIRAVIHVSLIVNYLIVFN